MSKHISTRAFTVAIWIASIVIALTSAVASSLMGGKSYVVASIVITLCAVAPEFIIFEYRKPQAKELVMIAVMCAIAIISRVAFAMLPNLKPMAGIVMIAGMAMGPRAGFLIGATSMLLSDLIFGMGPWAPWQMLSFGLCGVFGGLIVKGSNTVSGRWSARRRIAMSVACAVFFLLIAGPILDTSSIFLMISIMNAESIIAVYAAGLPINAMQAGATFLTIVTIAPIFLRKISYIRERYGLI